MDFKTIAILIPMTIGFITLVVSIYSLHSFIRSTIKDATDSTNLRINDLKTEIERRFENVDKRFEDVDKRFENVDKRFENVDKRFENVDKRFENVDKRFEDLYSKFDEVKIEIREIKIDLREVRSRLDVFIDNFAIRMMPPSVKLSRKKG